MRFRRLLISALFVMSLSILTVGVGKEVAAAPVTQFAACSNASSFFGFPSWDACLPKEGGKPVIKSLDDVWKIAFPIIETLIKATGYIAVGFIIWGGVKYIISQGTPANTAAAQKTILNAVIGLVIAVLSVAIVRFIADRF